MRRNLSRFCRGAGFGLCALLCVGGCGRPLAKSTDTEKPEKKDPLANLPGAIQGHGWHIPWMIRDPRHPNGPALPVLIADAQFGAITDRNGNPTVVLEHARAQLFHDGRHVADVQAAQITADQRRRVLTGTGGCMLKSVPTPESATVITADTISWDTRSNRIVAYGHAHVEGKRKKIPFSSTGGRITYDMARDEVRVE
jgi:hypothetical protein